VVLPGSEHRLRYDNGQSAPRLVGADGTTGVPDTDITTDQHGHIRVRRSDGEWQDKWRLDADRVVRGYQRTGNLRTSPANRLRAWYLGNPDEPDPDVWRTRLDTLKSVHRLSTRADTARLLGYSEKGLQNVEGNPTADFRRRVRVAEFLMSEGIGGWHFESSPGGRGFRVVFDVGSTLVFDREGRLSAQLVGLPGTGLDVRYDGSGDEPPRLLVTRNGKQVLPEGQGWQLWHEADGSVTVRQSHSVTGETGSGELGLWRVSAGRTLESFTLPSTGPTTPGAYTQLTRIGVLGRHPVPPQLVPVPADPAPMVSTGDHPDLAFPVPEPPGSMTGDAVGPSTLHTITWSDT
jgi:hypothetical protein